MKEILELAILSEAGIVDCRLELQDDSNGNIYEATIIYPQMVNGINRSEIYCFEMVFNKQEASWYILEPEASLPQKIQMLQEAISTAIRDEMQPHS